MSAGRASLRLGGAPAAAPLLCVTGMSQPAWDEGSVGGPLRPGHLDRLCPSGRWTVSPQEAGRRLTLP